MTPGPLLQSQVPGIPCRRGKVRDVYDLGDRLVIVATDRISAFDWILPTGIPDKGRVLTALTRFWLDYLKVPNHLLSTDPAAMGRMYFVSARRDVEHQIHALEARLAEIGERLGDPAFYADGERVRAVAAERKSAEEQVTWLMREWEQLSTALAAHE